MRGVAVAAARYAGIYGTKTCQELKAGNPISGISRLAAFRSFMTGSETIVPGFRENTATTELKNAHTAPKRLTFNKGKSAGRNSQGRITSFHRGGGSKQLYRKIDLKRNTPSMGIVERIEYDPNRSSRIALVRWYEGGQLGHERKLRTKEKFTPPIELLEPKATAIQGNFSLCSLSKGVVGQRDLAGFSSRPKASSLVVGLPTGTSALSKGLLNGNGTGSERSNVKDVFYSVFHPKVACENTHFSSSLSGLPRVAVAGAKPPFYASRMRENDGDKNSFSLDEIHKWKTNSIYWAHRMKRKAAVSWHSFR